LTDTCHIQLLATNCVTIYAYTTGSNQRIGLRSLMNLIRTFNIEYFENKNNVGDRIATTDM